MSDVLIANELLAVAESLFAMDFSNQEAMDNYLKDHPDADRSNHKVVKKVKAPKADDIPEHLKKTFEKGTLPLRKNLSYGDDVAFMHGKEYFVGQLTDSDDDWSDFQVTLRDGKKFTVSRGSLRMPKGGRRVRDV